MNVLKRVIWSRIKAKMQQRQIQSELKEYTNIIVKSKGVEQLELLHDQDFIRTEVGKKLKVNKIGPLVNEKGDLNIVYMSPLDPWEEVNMPDSLAPFGNTHFLGSELAEELTNLDIKSKHFHEARKEFNKSLLKQVKELHESSPIDIVVNYFSGRYILKETVEAINALRIRTVAFWLDTDLKFKSKFDGVQFTGAATIASAFHLNLCSDSSSLRKFYAEGAICAFWPEGANPNHFKPIPNLSKKYDVSFIGAKYGLRGEYINYLRSNGVKVTCFGWGWEGGKLSSSQMIEVYAQSKVCLGFGGIGYSMTVTNLKGRDFEVPMCGAAYVTTFDEDLAKLYELNKQIFTYRTKAELLEKVKWLVEDDTLRTNTANAAREHALENHTWEKRFDTAFEYFK